MAGAVAALPLIGTVIQTVGAVVGGLNEAATLEREQDAAEDAAAQERLVAADEARDFRVRQSAALARSRAGRGASGVNVFDASSLLLDTATFQEIQLGEARLLQRGEARARQFENRADALDFQKENARLGAVFAGITGATKLTGTTTTLLADRATPARRTSFGSRTSVPGGMGGV